MNKALSQSSSNILVTQEAHTATFNAEVLKDEVPFTWLAQPARHEPLRPGCNGKRGT